MLRWTKILIWVYIALLLFEGALRKWILPGFANPLLVVRDPVLIVIYMLAIAQGIFPSNRFIAAIAVLAVLSVGASIAGGNDNLLVIIYGLRINYFHLPLIWIMGSVLTRHDVERVGAALLVLAIPMTLVMVQQFRSPMDAYINKGIGDDAVGQLFGADGKIRPPGLFAFITGPQLFYPLVAAFFFDEIAGAKRLPWYILMACGIAIAIALPVSISRTVMLGTAVVAVAFLLSLRYSSSKLTGLARPILLLSLVAGGLSQLPVFREGSEVFMMRWDTAAAESEGAAFAGLMDRTVNGFTNPWFFVQEAPFLGYGIGTGSNVGARLMTGQVGFMLAEEEWGKILLELGPIIGLAFIFFRIALTCSLGWTAWLQLKHERNALPLLIFAATAMAILQGQWGPPTVLGFAVVGSGLLLAACRTAPASRSENGRSDGSEREREPALAADDSFHRAIRPLAAIPAESPRRLPNILRPSQR